MADAIRESKREETPKQVSFLLCSTAIILLGFFLRIYRIGEQELWLDEAASFYQVQLPNWFNSYTLTENTPPLYYLFLRSWTQFLEKVRYPFAYHLLCSALLRLFL